MRGRRFACHPPPNGRFWGSRFPGWLWQLVAILWKLKLDHQTSARSRGQVRLIPKFTGRNGGGSSWLWFPAPEKKKRKESEESRAIMRILVLWFVDSRIVYVLFCTYVRSSVTRACVQCLMRRARACSCLLLTPAACVPYGVEGSARAHQSSLGSVAAWASSHGDG